MIVELRNLITKIQQGIQKSRAQHKTVNPLRQYLGKLPPQTPKLLIKNLSLENMFSKMSEKCKDYAHELNDDNITQKYGEIFYFHQIYIIIIYLISHIEFHINSTT